MIMDGLLPTVLLMMLMGFMGSLHCIGMCGGLISAVSMSRPRIWWSGLLVYQLGRVTSYTLLGLLVGIAGMAISAFGGDWIQRPLAVVAGLLMIFFAMNLAGWLPDSLRRASLWVSRKTGLARLAQCVASDARSRGWYLLGLANGLLPCGLVYAALALAMAAEDTLTAMSMMTGFGMGTIPAMMVVPSLLRGMTPALRSRALRVAALLLLLVGVMTILRSIMPLHAMPNPI